MTLYLPMFYDPDQHNNKEGEPFDDAVFDSVRGAFGHITSDLDDYRVNPAHKCVNEVFEGETMQTEYYVLPLRYQDKNSKRR